MFIIFKDKTYNKDVRRPDIGPTTTRVLTLNGRLDVGGFKISSLLMSWWLFLESMLIYSK